MPQPLKRRSPLRSALVVGATAVINQARRRDKHSAGIQDRDGAALLFDKIRRRFPWLECVFADACYNAQQTYEAAVDNALRLEIVGRNPHAAGFEVIKRRWVVERTFSWFGRNRRLAKKLENLAATLLASVTLAAIQLGVRRLAR